MTGLPGPWLGLLEFSQPMGLWFLLLPLALWILARRQPQPKSLFSAAIRFWNELHPSQGSAAARRRMPIRPLIWVVLLALSLGALGMAGLAPSGAEPGNPWRVVVDTSPSMYLGTEDAGAQGATRMERGLREASALLSATGHAADSVEWVFGTHAALQLPLGEAPPAAWLVPGRLPAAAPSWHLEDRLGSLWLTDRIPPDLPIAAGLLAVGGHSVAGPIGVDGTDWIHWDGASLRRTPGAPKTRLVALEQRLTPSAGWAIGENPLSELFLLWARERHFELAIGPGDPADLMLSFAGVEPSNVGCSAALARWSLQGSGTALHLEANPGRGSESPWLRGWAGQDKQAVLVASSPGRIRVAWSSMEAPQGSQVAFALAWSQLFDECLLAPVGVIELAERIGPGPALTISPRPMQSRLPGNRGESSWSLWLAASAALLSLLALAWEFRAA